MGQAVAGANLMCTRSATARDDGRRESLYKARRFGACSGIPDPEGSDLIKRLCISIGGVGMVVLALVCAGTTAGARKLPAMDSERPRSARETIPVACYARGQENESSAAPELLTPAAK